MNARIEYEMTEADFQRILEASKPVPYLVIGGHPPSSPQENANRAWAELGKRMGFDPMTPQPISGKSHLHFTAVPCLTEEQIKAIQAEEARAIRAAEIAHLKASIETDQKRLKELECESSPST